MFPKNIGTDELSIGKILSVLFILFIIISLAWISINVQEQEYRNKAFWYWVLGLTGLVWILVDHALKALDIEIIDTCIYENTTLYGRLSKEMKALMFIGLMVVFYVIFAFTNFKQTALVNAPLFQAVELGNEGRILATISFALVEGLVFVGCLAPTIYGIFTKISKSPHFGLLSMLIITPTLFMLFHMAVYGFTDMIAMISTFLFNFVSCVMLFLMRNIFWEWSVHTANNAGLIFAKIYRFSLEILFFPLVVIGFLIFLVVVLVKK